MRSYHTYSSSYIFLFIHIQIIIIAYNYKQVGLSRLLPELRLILGKCLCSNWLLGTVARMPSPLWLLVVASYAITLGSALWALEGYCTKSLKRLDTYFKNRSLVEEVKGELPFLTRWNWQECYLLLEVTENGKTGVFFFLLLVHHVNHKG